MAFFKVQLAIVLLLSLILLAQSAPVEINLKPVVRDDEKWCKGLPYAIASGDDCEDYIVKHQEEERKRQEEATKRIIEERKKTAEDRKKTAEEVAKAIEEAVKNVEDGKASIPRDAGYNSSDVDLYLTAALGKGVGQCKIEVHREEIKMCYMYVKTRVPDVHKDYGFPKQTLPDGSTSGSGCVEQEDGPKGHDGSCRYTMPSYGFTEEVSWTICSKYGYFNAVNMVRMAIKQGKC